MTCVTVYVAPGCPARSRTYELVEKLRKSTQQHTVVRIMHADEAEEELPEDLFAVPAWYINGTLFCLGNPSDSQIRTIIKNANAD